MRARRARERIDSYAANPARSSDNWSSLDWREVGTSSRGRTSPVGEPMFTPADWSLPSFRGSTATTESGSTATARPQPERSRPATLEPQVRDPFDSWPSDLWLSTDDAPRRSAPRRPFDTSHRNLSDILASPGEPYSMPGLFDEPTSLELLRERDTLEWLFSDSRSPAAAAPAELPHGRPPSRGNPRRDHAPSYVDPSDDTSAVDPFGWRRYPLRGSLASASRRENPDRDANRPNADGLEANSRRRISRLLALRSMRGGLVAERDPSPSRSPTRTALPPALPPDSDPSDSLEREARAELPTSVGMRGVFASSPRQLPMPRDYPLPTAVRRPAPAARPAAAGDTAARTNPTSRFNIDSFFEGPFRATIQRSLELENQQRRALQPPERESGAPSLPPLRFQRSRDERLVSSTSYNEMYGIDPCCSRLCRAYHALAKAQTLRAARRRIHTHCIHC